MIRSILAAVALLCLLGAAIATILQPLAWPTLLVAGLFALGILAERFYYRGGGAALGSGGGWQPTRERFLDEETQRPVTVWFNAVTGERRYVEEGAPPPA